MDALSPLRRGTKELACPDREQQSLYNKDYVLDEETREGWGGDSTLYHFMFIVLYMAGSMIIGLA